MVVYREKQKQKLKKKKFDDDHHKSQSSKLSVFVCVYVCFLYICFYYGVIKTKQKTVNNHDEYIYEMKSNQNTINLMTK